MSRNLLYNICHIILALAAIANAVCGLYKIYVNQEYHPYIITALIILIYIEIRETRKNPQVIMTYNEFKEHLSNKGESNEQQQQEKHQP